MTLLFYSFFCPSIERRVDDDENGVVLYWDLCVQLSEDEYPDDDKIEREANVSKYTYVHIK